MGDPPTFKTAKPRQKAVVLSQTLLPSDSTLSVMNSTSASSFPNFGGQPYSPDKEPKKKAKKSKEEVKEWKVSGEVTPNSPPHPPNPTEVLYSELKFQQQIERRRLREKIRELEAIVAEQKRLEKEIRSMTETASNVEARLQAFSAHESATCSQFLEKITDWPDDPISITVRDVLIEIQTTLFEFIGHPGELGMWCGAVSHAIGRLHHNVYIIAKAAPFYDILSSTRGDLKFESDGVKSKIGSFRVPANGFRSILKVLEVYLGKLLKKVQKNTADAKKGRHCNFKMGDGLGSIVDFITTFIEVTSYCIQIIESTAPLEIFPLAGCESVLDKILSKDVSEPFNFDVFYGKLFGLQYNTGMRHIFMGLLLAMLSFGRNFKGDSPELFNKAKALFASPMSLIDNSGTVSEYFTSPDIQFLRSFWNLQESCAVVGVDTAIRTKSPDLNFVFHLPTTPLLIPLVDGDGLVKIGPGLSLVTDTHGSVMDESMQSVQVRLISFSEITGQITNPKDFEKKKKKSHVKDKDKEEQHSTSSISFAPKGKDPKDNLILHFHGGGFVAQTSKAHLSYLRDYGSSLDVPILTVDYSLAPDYPYPRAQHECFYAYCWALNNPSLLGWNGKRIILTGDSAGGNLAIAVTMLAISNEIRVPDFLFPLYPALLALPVPTPSRLLSVMDPLLGTGILLKCLESYVGDGSGLDPFMSPTLCPVEILRRFPPTFIQTGELDPLLDDSIDFVHKLRRIRTVDAEITVISFKLSPDIHFGSKKFAPMVVVQKNGRNIGATYPWKDHSPAHWSEAFRVKNWSYGEKITLKVVNSAYVEKDKKKKGKSRKMARTLSPPRRSPKASSASPPPMGLSLTPPPSSFSQSTSSSSPSSDPGLPSSLDSSISSHSPRSPRKRRKRSIPDISTSSSTSSFSSASSKHRGVFKPSLCVGSLDLTLPPTNDRILKTYMLSSELGSIDIKTAILETGKNRNICMEIGAIHFNSKVDKHTMLYVDVGGMEKTSKRTVQGWQEGFLTKPPTPPPSPTPSFAERIYTPPPPTFDRDIIKETGGVPIALQDVPPSTQVIRVKIMADVGDGDDVLVGEAMVPLPLTTDIHTQRDKTQKTTFVNYSFGRKIGELEIELHPTFLSLEKDVYFQLMPSMPHGYLGFNRVEAESTKATQAAIKVLKFACEMGPAPIDGLHSCFSSKQEDELGDRLSEKFDHQANHMGTIHLGKQGIKGDLKPEKQRAFELTSHLRVVENTGFSSKVAIGDLVSLTHPTKSSSEYVDILVGDVQISHFPQKYLAPASIDESSLYDSIVLHVDGEKEGDGKEIEGGKRLGAGPRSWPIIPPNMTAIVKVPGSMPDFPDMSTDKKKGAPPTFHLKICFLGSEMSGRREMFLACSLKRPVHNPTYYDPKIVSIRGFEALSGLGFVKYDLLDCPLSLVQNNEELEKETREAVRQELSTADLVCLCISLIDAPSIPKLKALIPRLKSITEKPIILIGTRKDERDATPTTDDIQTVLGSDSLKRLMDPLPRTVMISPKLGQELMEDIGASAYVEVSSKNFQGFRTLTNTGLAVAFGANAKAQSGPALSDKMRKKMETASTQTPKDEKCKVM